MSSPTAHGFSNSRPLLAIRCYFGAPFRGSTCLFVGQPERYVELCRAQLTRTGDANTFATANLVAALQATGSTDEALVIADGLIDAAELSGNPWVLSHTAWRIVMPLHAHLQHSHRNGGSAFSSSWRFLDPFGRAQTAPQCMSRESRYRGGFF
jgi:hypothetical protein